MTKWYGTDQEVKVGDRYKLHTSIFEIIKIDHVKGIVETRLAREGDLSSITCSVSMKKFTDGSRLLVPSPPREKSGFGKFLEDHGL